MPVDGVRGFIFAGSDVPAVEESPENFALVSCGENAKLVTQRPNAMDDCESGADTGPRRVRSLRPQTTMAEISPNAHVLADGSSTTMLANEKVPSADEPTSSSLIHQCSELHFG